MKKYFFIKVTLLLLFGLWSISCQREDRFELEEEGTAITNFVSQSDALRVAESFDFSKKQFNSSSGESKGSKKVVDILDFPANSIETYYYLVNYEKGGFAIISADNRLIPVLAFSETNSFATEEKNYPGGLVDWLSAIIEVIKETRILNVEQTPEIKALWDKYSVENDTVKHGNSKSTMFDPSDCPYEGYTFYTSQQYGPLCSTQWGQEEPFNNYVEYLGCSNTSNGRAKTGCIATAMAQVMKYNAFPNSYNWGSMPNDSANSEVMQLMLDCGDAVGMDYDCYNSTSSITNIPAALINSFNYTSASNASYSYTTVKNEIQNNHPVILHGWLNRWSDIGHTWVADGSLEIFYYQCVYNPFYQEYELVNTVNYLYFNMNWGLSGTSNGWYAFNNFNPSFGTFNYQPKMTYNIRH